MNPKLIFLFVVILFSFHSEAQKICNLHIVTSPNNRMAGFKLEFNVNGAHYKLKPGQCLELKLHTDSVHILMSDTRWVKKEPVNVHVAAQEHLYVQIIWGYIPAENKKTRPIAEVICKACFDEMKLKCKEERTE